MNRHKHNSFMPNRPFSTRVLLVLHASCNILMWVLLVDPTRYSRAVLVNNAASIGHIGRSNDQTSLRALKEYVDLNVTSCIWITTRFAHLFGAHGPMKSQAVEYKGRTSQPTAETTGDSDGSEGGDRPLSGCKSVVVHVSSVMAMKPIKYFANYAAGKAARDMFHK